MAERNGNENTSKLACESCLKEYLTLKALTCNHQLCNNCTNQCKDGPMWICKVCKKPSNRAPLLVNSAATQKLLKQVDEIKRRYEKDLGRRSEKCEEQLKKLQEHISNLGKEKEERNRELEKVCAERTEDLQTHYEELKAKVSKHIKERENTFKRLLKDIQQSLDDIRTERKELKRAHEKCQSDVNHEVVQELTDREELSKAQDIEIDYKPFKVSINTNPFEDAIDISAPPLVLHRTTSENGQHKLESLKSFEEQFKVTCPSTEPSQRLILGRNRLYNVEGRDGASSYDLTLKKPQVIKVADMENFFGMDELSDGTFVCASSEGLFHLDSKGIRTNKFNPCFHSDVRVHCDDIYAAFNDVVDNKPLCEIHKYKNTKLDHWTRDTVIKLPCEGDHHITLCFSHDFIYSGCIVDHVVHVINREGGAILKQFDGSRTGLFRNPVMSQCDQTSLLMCDSYNNSVMILTNDSWTTVLRPEQLEKLSGAVYFAGKLYLVAGDDEKMLIKYKACE